jgi:AmiR/NasT family two-component response regulator
MSMPGTAVRPLEQFSRLTITLVSELDEQGNMLLRELQRTRARVRQRWPVPERIGEETDIVVCEYMPDLSRRCAWMPGEATAASIVLLPQSGQYDIRTLQAALPDAVMHRPYSPQAIQTALVIGWDHFSFARRQRSRIARLDENVRSLRDIERAKLVIMAEKNISEYKAFNVLRDMAMERRITIAALAASLVDSRHGVG